ncbi:MAG: SIR2 family protein [Deltaproteobacteria bacterium]|nr:SIR2 family protein [Deltaproteobacteria bacterium]
MEEKKTDAAAPNAASAAAAQPTTGAATSAPSPPTPTGPVHCPYRRTTDLLQRLAPNKMRVGFFIGAGCSLSVQGADGKPLIPEIDGLTKLVKGYLDNDAKLKAVAQTAWDRVAARSIPTPTVEDVLSHIRTLKSLCGKGAKDVIDGFSADLLDELDLTICEQIRNIVSKPLPTSDTPYHVLASWIQAIPRDRPVEIFTTNYDLSLEQALEEQLVPYFDGFVGSDSAFLDLDSMAEDDLPSRWARLWKIHGSINWWMTAKQKIRRSRDKVEGEQLLIYPSHLKYDQSRQMPYYAMLDRLRVFLRSAQCVLLTCGYSFGDEHINAIIAQGLSGNSNAACLAMIFNDREKVPKGVVLAKRHANLTLLAADGGVVGTIDRDWDSIVKDDNPAYPIAVATDLSGSRTTAPADRCKWLLGDFAALGRLLAHQLSTRDIEQGVSDAP